MAFTYKPLWKILIDKEMSKVKLRDELGLSPSTLAKLSKDEYVSMEVLDRICRLLHCRIEDVVEYVFDEESK